MEGTPVAELTPSAKADALLLLHLTRMKQTRCIAYDSPPNSLIQRFSTVFRWVWCGRYSYQVVLL